MRKVENMREILIVVPTLHLDDKYNQQACTHQYCDLSSIPTIKVISTTKQIANTPAHRHAPSPGRASAVP